MHNDLGASCLQVGKQIVSSHEDSLKIGHGYLLQNRLIQTALSGTHLDLKIHKITNIQKIVKST